METFVCYLCGGTFPKGTPGEEALAELKQYFGDVSPENCELVCDECWEKVKPND